MKAGGKDRPPMLAPGSSETTTERYMENYKNVSQDIRDQLNAEVEAKSIERLKQGESINVQVLETNLYWEFRKFTSRDDESLKSYYSRGTGYDNRRIVNVVRARETVDQELEAHYMYMEQIQEVNPDAADNSGPIFDFEPLPKVSNNDNYNVFAIESEHPEQSKYVHDTYPIEQDKHNVIIDSLDMSYNREQLDQDDDDDLANERDLLASLIEKLKCEIDDSKNCSRGTDLYPITLQDTSSPNPICLMAKAASSQAWLWHRHLSHLNFDTINLLSMTDIVIGLLKLKFIKDHLCSSCELGKAKRKSFQTKTTSSSKDGYNF
nr:retrovirus-related Pol polyprotein from transposon TNT 1-94 [Tanacetum cinerariifolium]